MSPYKNWLNATRAFLDSNGFLRFLLSAYIVVFSVGGGLLVLGTYFFGFFSYFLICTGTIIMFAGLLLMFIKEDMMVLLIISGILSVASLGAWIYKLVALGGLDLYGFGVGGLFVDWFTPMFYFLAFGAIALLVLLLSDKFKQMRAASAARSRMAGVACPRCGSFVPMTAAFCPACGAPNPVQAPPQPQYAPPGQPQYGPPVQPQYAPPAQQYAPPAQQYAPPAPPVQPQEQPAETGPVAPKCVNCGADIQPGAVFCAHCGAKQ